MAQTNIIGPAPSRVDGRLKVTGAAKYAVEFPITNCAYGWTVESNIAKGKILSIETKAAESARSAEDTPAIAWSALDLLVGRRAPVILGVLCETSASFAVKIFFVSLS